MKNKYKVLIVIGVVILISLFKVLLSYPDTNKNDDFSNVQDRVYKNTAYNFSITFPEGWDIKPGEDSDSQAVVQKAVKDTATISVAVREVPLAVGALSSPENTIEDLVDFEDNNRGIKADMEKALPGVRDFEFGKSSVGQIPAYWVKYIGPSSLSNSSTEDSTKMYQLFHNNILYMITVSSSLNDFSGLEKVFNDSVNSFQII